MINAGNIRIKVLESYNETDDLLLYNLGAKGVVTIALNQKFVLQIRIRAVFEGFNINDFCTITIEERISGHIINSDSSISKIRYVLGDNDELAIKKCLREYIKRKIEKESIYRDNKFAPDKKITDLIKLVDLYIDETQFEEKDFTEVIGTAKFKIDDEIILKVSFTCVISVHSLDFYYKECSLIEPKEVVVEKVETHNMPNIIELGKIGINDSHVYHMQDVITQEVERFCTLQII